MFCSLFICYVFLSSPPEVYNARFWKFLLERSPLAKIRNFIRHCATNVKMKSRFKKVGDLALPCKMIDMKIRRVTSNNWPINFVDFLQFGMLIIWSEEYFGTTWIIYRPGPRQCDALLLLLDSSFEFLCFSYSLLICTLKIFFFWIA